MASCCHAILDFLADSLEEPTGNIMGRTIPTYRMQLEQERHRWRRFRDALRAEDQPVFDSMFAYCRTYADAGSAVARACTSEAIFMSILLGLYQEVQRLRYALAEAARNAAENDEESHNDGIRRVKVEV